VSLGGCRLLTDQTLAHVTALPRLEELNVAATLITDAGLAALRAAGPALTSLNLYACLGISVHGVTEALALPNLKMLNIRGCSIEPSLVEQLQSRFPRVEILTGPLYEDGIY